MKSLNNTDLNNEWFVPDVDVADNFVVQRNVLTNHEPKKGKVLANHEPKNEIVLANCEPKNGKYWPIMKLKKETY